MDVGADQGAELLSGELVDVIFAEHVLLGNDARLPGPDDYPHDGGVQALPDVLDNIDAGGVGLHHDVEEHKGNVGVAVEHLAGLLRVRGVEKPALLAEYLVAAYRKLGDVENLLLIVNDKDFPWSRAGRAAVISVDFIEKGYGIRAHVHLPEMLKDLRPK